MKKIIQVTPLFFKMSFLTLLFFVIAAPKLTLPIHNDGSSVTPLATDDENNIASGCSEAAIRGCINTNDGIKPSTFGLQNPKTDAVTDTEVNRLHAPAGQAKRELTNNDIDMNITEPERFEGMGAEMLRTEPERFEGMGAEMLRTAPATSVVSEPIGPGSMSGAEREQATNDAHFKDRPYK